MSLSEGVTIPYLPCNGHTIINNSWRSILALKNNVSPFRSKCHTNKVCKLVDTSLV